MDKVCTIFPLCSKGKFYFISQNLFLNMHQNYRYLKLFRNKYGGRLIARLSKYENWNYKNLFLEILGNIIEYSFL